MRKLDLRGLKCPLPVLKTRKFLAAMAPGERVEVSCTGSEVGAAARQPGAAAAGGDEGALRHEPLRPDGQGLRRATDLDLQPQPGLAWSAAFGMIVSSVGGCNPTPPERRLPSTPAGILNQKLKRREMIFLAQGAPFGIALMNGKAERKGLPRNGNLCISFPVKSRDRRCVKVCKPQVRNPANPNKPFENNVVSHWPRRSVVVLFISDHLPKFRIVCEVS